MKHTVARRVDRRDVRPSRNILPRLQAGIAVVRAEIRTGDLLAMGRDGLWAPHLSELVAIAGDWPGAVALRGQVARGDVRSAARVWAREVRHQRPAVPGLEAT